VVADSLHGASHLRALVALAHIRASGGCGKHAPVKPNTKLSTARLPSHLIVARFDIPHLLVQLGKLINTVAESERKLQRDLMDMGK